MELRFGRRKTPARCDDIVPEPAESYVRHHRWVTDADPVCTDDTAGWLPRAGRPWTGTGIQSSRARFSLPYLNLRSVVRPSMHPDPSMSTDGLRHASSQAHGLPRAGLPDPRLKPYLLTSEVAELLHAAPKTVGNWAKQGKLPYLRTLGGHRRYPTGPILRMAAALSTTLRPEAPRGAAPDVRRSDR